MEVILRQFEAYRGCAWVFTWYDTILYKELEDLRGCYLVGPLALLPQGHRRRKGKRGLKCTFEWEEIFLHTSLLPPQNPSLGPHQGTAVLCAVSGPMLGQPLLLFVKRLGF